VAETVRVIKERHPGVEICTSLGLLTPDRAERLAEAGVFAYNHNLNTSEANYGEICSTHTYADRVETVGLAHMAGLSPCSGAIFGMGESDDEIVDLAFDLRKLDPDSVPINFLIPFEGTPLGGEWQLTPQRCLRILALFRFFFPDSEVRIAGGREIHLRTLQTLGLHLANSIFLGDYLTSEGQAGKADLQMIVDAGFVVEGQEEDTLSGSRRDLVTLRRRGPVPAFLPTPDRRLKVGHSDGHGLGLAIDRAIADAPGATLAARGRPQAGLEVQVSFPSSNTR
jgi:biotin synthase